MLGCPLKNPLESDVAIHAPDMNRRSQLLQDINLIDQISHITRERIPERYMMHYHTEIPPILTFSVARFVHAKGTGVKGYFKVEFDANSANSFNPADYSHADFLKASAKETRLFARFSTVG